jgi:hypothetical protein
MKRISTTDEIFLGVANLLALRVSYEGFTETEWTKLDIYVFICNTMFRTLSKRFVNEYGNFTVSRALKT